METYHALILGIVQGLTEFLPVSSSGHLALGQYIFNIKEPTLFFDISLHIGTLFAVVIVFFDNIKSICISIFEFLKLLGKSNINDIKNSIKNSSDIRFVLLIVVGSIPTAIIGLFLKQYVDILFDSINFVGTMLLITGTFLWFTKDIKKDGFNLQADSKNQKQDDEKVLYDNCGKIKTDVNIMNFGYKQALFIGFAQGCAVVPGISRSGATIAAGLFAGIERETAAKFSFLLSIPAIVGAEMLGLKDVLYAGGSAAFINMKTLYGTIISFIVGYLALKLLLKIVRVGRLHLFAPYCWILGVVAIIAGVL